MSLDKLREIEAAATPGPWLVDDENGGYVFVDEPHPGADIAQCLWSHELDAEFIATARNTYAALLDVAEFACEMLNGGHFDDYRGLSDRLDRIHDLTPS